MSPVLTINVHEEAARLRKVMRFCDAIDSALLAMDVDPFSERASQAVETLSEAGWASAANQAGCRCASERTRDEIRALYAERARRAAAAGEER